MATATLSDFRQNQAHYITTAHVELRSRGAQTRAVLVSPAFYEEAIAALEAQREAREREEYETWLRENALPALEHYLEHPDTAHTLDELAAAWGLK